MKNKPLVSILIPVYNSCNFIDESISSVLNQTYDNIEIVIINDGSNDGTEYKLLSYASQYNSIRLINQENKGYCESLNLGINYCKGDYIARMDADDIMMNNRIALQVKYLEDNPDISILGSAIQYISSDGIVGRKHFFPSKKNISRSIFQQCPIAHPSVMIRRTVFSDIGFYRSNLFPAEDYDLWLRAYSKNVLIDNLSEVLLMYRVHSDNTSSQNVQRRALSSILAQKACLIRLTKNNDLLDNYKIDVNNYFEVLPEAFKPSEMEIFVNVNNIIYKDNLDELLTLFNKTSFNEKDRYFRIIFLLRVSYFYFRSFNYSKSFYYFILSFMISPIVSIQQIIVKRLER